MSKIKNLTFGQDILSRYLKLQDDLKRAGPEGVMCLITACIASGTDEEDEIASLVEQIGGQGFSDEVYDALNDDTGNMPWVEFPFTRYRLKAA